MADIYLASRFGRREELARYGAELESMGHRVVSRWMMTSDHEATDAELAAHPELATRFALEDVQDLMIADIVVCFTEPPNSTASRGGRHVEMGMALVTSKHIVIVGPAENVFCTLPTIARFDTWKQAIAALSVRESSWTRGFLGFRFRASESNDASARDQMDA